MARKSSAPKGRKRKKDDFFDAVDEDDEAVFMGSDEEGKASDEEEDEDAEEQETAEEKRLRLGQFHTSTSVCTASLQETHMHVTLFSTFHSFNLSRSRLCSQSVFGQHQARASRRR